MRDERPADLQPDSLFGRRDSNPASEIGESLRQTRIRLGHDLQGVSDHLHIRYPYLQAIENGNFAGLPGRTYAIGFVRSYASFLGLDADRAVALLKSESETLVAPNRLAFPSPAPEGNVPGGAIILVAAVLTVAAYAGWYYLDSSGHSVADLVPDVPHSLQSWIGEDSGGSSAPSNPPSRPVDSEAPAVVAAPGNTGLSGTLPDREAAPATITAEAAPGTIVAKLPEPTTTNAPRTINHPTTTSNDAEAPEPGRLAARTAPTATLFPARNRTDIVERPAADGADRSGTGMSAPGTDRPTSASRPTNETADSDQVANARPRVVIRAMDDSWVRIRDADASTLMARIMHAGESYEVPDQPGLRMTTGNAGALAIAIDGEQGGPLGNPGQVIRNIDLDPTQLRQRNN